MKIKKITAVAFGLLFSFSSFASMITYETRSLQLGNFDNSDYAQSWSNHSSSITSQSIPEFTQIYSGNNSFSHLAVDFNLGSSSSIWVDFGLDAGYGAAAYYDSVLVEKDPSDLWWQYNWNHGDVLFADNGNLTGNHTLDLYWAEGCCNGYNSGRFSTNYGQTWQALSTANLDSYAVPEPSIIALLGLGFVGIGFARKKSLKAK